MLTPRSRKGEAGNPPRIRRALSDHFSSIALSSTTCSTTSLSLTEVTFTLGPSAGIIGSPRIKTATETFNRAL